jgi:hypothetical protein
LFEVTCGRLPHRPSLNPLHPHHRPAARSFSAPKTQEISARSAAPTSSLEYDKVDGPTEVFSEFKLFVGLDQIGGATVRASKQSSPRRR